MEKPNSPSCSRNKDVILDVLKSIITKDNKSLLEVGSGTGQHAVYMAPHFEHMDWFVSDLVENHAGMQLWLQEAKIKNIHGPLTYEVGQSDFPKKPFDCVFAANVLHIMSWKDNKTLFKNFGTRLREGAQVIFYGPFNYNGEFTSESNAQFDLWLKKQNPHSGIRNFEDIEKVLKKHGFTLTKDFEMPANNRILLFTKL